MRNRSGDKKHQPKGFPFENNTASIEKNNLVCDADVPIQKIHSGNQDNRTHSYQNEYLISKAYSEPLGYDMVENMLLQRDYIID